MDAASNISHTLFFDSITLDSRPPPLAFVPNYFVSEGANSLEVICLLLSSSSVFPISAWITPPATARPTADSDYGSTNAGSDTRAKRPVLPFITNDTPRGVERNALPP